MNESPYISHASELPEKSTWRKYQEGIKELELWEAPERVITEFKYRAARTCFLAFADIMKEGSLRVAEFHEIIASSFEDIANKRYRKLIISCPPRSGKSMLSALFISWLMGIDGKSQHIIASYGLQLSNKLFKECLSYLKHPLFNKVFPEWQGFDQNSKYDMVSGGYILNTSVGGVCTGFTGGTPDENCPGVGVSLIDDPLKGSGSKAALEELEVWWAEELSTRKTNNWAQLIIGTRFHERDLHGLVMETDGLYDPESNPNGWRWVNIQGIIETEEQAYNDILGRNIGETHWPENSSFTPDMLLSQKLSMGSASFYALYMGTPTSKKGQIVKAGWIYTVPEEECPKLDLVWLSIDSALSEEDRACDTAVCVAGISHRDPSTIYIREIVKGKWGFPDLLAEVKNLNNFYRPRIICIERAASGICLIQTLKRETKIAVEEMKPMKSKSGRLEGVCPLLEAGRVKLVEGEWTSPFIKEVTSFPYSNSNDSTDAFSWALTYYILKLDSGDSGFRNAIFQARNNRLTPPPQDDEAPTPRYQGRMNNRENRINDPDYGNPSPLAIIRGKARQPKRNVGYETPLW